MKPDAQRSEGDSNDVVASLGLATSAERRRMRLSVLLVLAAAAAYLLARLLAPFTLAIVTSAVVAALARPAYRVMIARIRNRSAAAFALTSGVFLLVLIPLTGLVFVLIGAIDSGVSVVAERVEDLASREGPVWRWLESVARIFGVGEQELGEAVQNQVNRLGELLAGGTFDLVSGLGGWIAQTAIGLFTLFYLIRDGDAFLGVVRWLIPLDAPLTDALIGRTREIVSATVLGTLVVALVQGLLGGLTFWVLGLPGPALWGAVMSFFALLPAVGPPVVWLPAAIMLIASGELVRAVVLIAVGALVIGTVDNVLRAVLVSGRAQLHPLVVFFSVLGGILLFGAAGFLLGPILVVLAFSVLEIARIALEGTDRAEGLPTKGTIFARVAEGEPDDPNGGPPAAGEDRAAEA